MIDLILDVLYLSNLNEFLVFMDNYCFLVYK